MLPLFLELRNRKVLVFGGGEVAFRKARYFSGQAEVTAVSIDFCPEFRELDVRRIRADARDVMEEWIEWADFVIAATDDAALNNEIAALASSRGKFFNQASERGSFLIPSVIERETFVIAFSTMGRSPAMSRFLRIKMNELLGPEWELMVKLQEELRGVAKSTIKDQKERESVLRQVLDDTLIWELIRDDYHAARERAIKLLGDAR